MECGQWKSVNVWDDKWLKATHMSKLVSTKLEKCSIEKVAELRNPEEEGWNRRLLEQLFNEVQRELIMKTPMSAMGTKDILVWKMKRNGQYMESSGHEVAQRLKKQKRSEAESSATAEDGKKL